MAAYILRNVSDTLWTAVKTRSHQDGISLRAILLKLLELYASGHINIAAELRTK